MPTFNIGLFLLVAAFYLAQLVGFLCACAALVFLLRRRPRLDLGRRLAALAVGVALLGELTGFVLLALSDLPASATLVPQLILVPLPTLSCGLLGLLAWSVRGRRRYGVRHAVALVALVAALLGVMNLAVWAHKRRVAELFASHERDYAGLAAATDREAVEYSRVWGRGGAYSSLVGQARSYRQNAEECARQRVQYEQRSRLAAMGFD